MQQEKVKMILDSTRDKMMAFRKKNRPEMRSILGQSRNEIESILTDKQKERFKVLRKRGKKRFGNRAEEGKTPCVIKGKALELSDPPRKTRKQQRSKDLLLTGKGCHSFFS